MLITIIAFILTLSILIIVHELGHFLAAKSIGVGAEEFAIGFPPKLWAKKIGETVLKINAIPVGGYVKLKGEFEDDENAKSTDPKNLLSRSPLEHLYIFIAGVLMNFVLGVVLLWLSFMIGTLPIIPDMPHYSGLNENNKITIESVENNGTAQKAGLKAKDEIIAINGKQVVTDKDVISQIQTVNIESSPQVTVTIKRDNQEIDKTVTVYRGKISDANGQIVDGNKIGVTLAYDHIVKAGPITALKVAFLEAIRIISITFLAIINMFALLFTKFQLSNQVTGPVGIFVATGYFARTGFTIYLQFLALLSLSLALFNILPIPALDGGQIFFTLLEVITRRKLSYKVKNVIQLVGFSLLILLIIVVSVKDLINFNIINNILNIFKG